MAANLESTQPTTINYLVGAITGNNGSQELYIIDNSGNLWRYAFSSATWTNLGAPSNATVSHATVIFSGIGYAYVLGFGSDGNLWNWCEDPSTPGNGWQNLQGATNFMNPFVKNIAAVNVRDGNVYAFCVAETITTNVYELWLCNWAGSQGFIWTDLGRPATTQNTLQWGTAVNMTDGGPYAFFLDNAGSICYNNWNGNWGWTNAAAMPPGITTMIPVGSVNLNGVANIFFLDWAAGDSDHLWCCYNNGTRYFWADLGKPGSPTTTDPMPKNMVVIQGSDGNAYVFLLCYDTNMWCWVGQNGIGAWQKVGNPGGVNLQNPGWECGAATQGISKPNLIVADADGNIWMASWNTSSGSWGWSQILVID